MATFLSFRGERRLRLVSKGGEKEMKNSVVHCLLQTSLLHVRTYIVLYRNMYPSQLLNRVNSAQWKLAVLVCHLVNTAVFVLHIRLDYVSIFICLYVSVVVIQSKTFDNVIFSQRI